MLESAGYINSPFAIRLLSVTETAKSVRNLTERKITVTIGGQVKNKKYKFGRYLNKTDEKAAEYLLQRRRL